MKYFGTDGIRGLANQKITPELAMQVGLALGELIDNSEHQNVVIGNDSRISADMIEHALCAGLLAKGVNVYKLDVIPTPGVAYITANNNFNFGIMISASHNPYGDNGIKIFGSTGEKILPTQEKIIEQVIDGSEEKLRPLHDEMGRVYEGKELVEQYQDYLTSTISKLDKPLKVALDLSNGANSSFATEIFTKLNCEVVVIGNTPDGININEQVGSTYPQTLSQVIKDKGDIDLGFAFDGDGDRIIAFDNNGNILDGDHILYLLGSYYLNTNQLANQTVVATVMANLGFSKAMEELNINVDYVQVGDKYVMESMNNNGYSLGGEQSGHIIIDKFAKTGDGVLVALQILEVVDKLKLPISKLTEKMVKYPQTLINVPVDNKKVVMESEQLTKVIREVEEDLDGNGRILVRASGTEELVRVMAEAPTQELSDQCAKTIVEYIKTM